MTAIHYPPVPLVEITAKLQAYTASHGGTVEKRHLKALMDQVCSYAHSAGMTPEGMVIALREAYQSVIAERIQDEDRLHAVYDVLLEGCLSAYFDEQARRAR